MDSVQLARLGADYFITSAGTSAASYYDNTLRWAHAHDGWGLYNTHCFRPSPGGIYFTFNQLWHLIMYGNNPNLPSQFARHVRNQRQWAGATSLARVAVLHHQNTLQMLLSDPRPMVNREQSVLKTIQQNQPAGVIYTRAPEMYEGYQVLLAPPYSVRGLSPQIMQALRDFVEAGGTIVSLDAEWSTAKADLTDERSLTAQMMGVTYGAETESEAVTLHMGDIDIPVAETTRKQVAVEEDTRVLAQFDDKAPAVTEKTMGEGRIVGIHFDISSALEKGDNPGLAAWFNALVAEYSKPEVTADGSGFRIMGALKKGNWVSVALYPETIPTTAKLHVNMSAAGIPKTDFRMLMLGKEMEIRLPGDRWGEEGFWTASMLQNGFDVTITEDNESHLRIPEEFDLEEFDEKEAAYIDAVTRDLWANPNEGRQKRNYAHEIVILAPGDEPVMPE